MLSNEELQQIRSIIREELNPIEDDIKLMKSDINVIKEDIGTIKDDVSDAVDKINMISEWCEAATEYHIHEIHYPLEPSEKLK